MLGRQPRLRAEGYGGRRRVSRRAAPLASRVQVGDLAETWGYWQPWTASGCCATAQSEGQLTRE